MQCIVEVEGRSELSLVLFSLFDKCLAVQIQPKSVFSKAHRHSFVTSSCLLQQRRRDPGPLGHDVAKSKRFRVLWGCGYGTLSSVPPLSWDAVPRSPDPSDQARVDGLSAAAMNIHCQKQQRRPSSHGLSRKCCSKSYKNSQTLFSIYAWSPDAWSL